ncbi:tetratricopeptide repeat protein, partial [archaeon]
GAVRAFRRACELAPCVARYASTLASCLYATGDMRGAVTAYEQSLVLEPQNADVLNNLGNAHRELGASSEAVTCYNRALQLAPQHPHAWNNLGNCMKDAGDLAAALTCYRTACTYMPAFAAARSNLASALKESGHTGEAIAQYHEALRADPHFADAWSNLGNTLKESGRLNDAIQCYTNAVSIRPSFADAHANLACALKDCGRVLEAAHVYQQALALRPTFADAHTNLIHCYLLVCDWREHSSGYDTLLRLLLPQIASILGRREVEAALRASGDARELEAWRLATGRALLPEGGSRSCAPTDPASTNTVLSPASEGAADAAGDAAELSDAEFGQRIHMSGWLPAVQPFHSLVYPMSLALMRLLAHCYAKRTAQAALSSGLPLRRGGAAVGVGSAGRHAAAAGQT